MSVAPSHRGRGRPGGRGEPGTGTAAVEAVAPPLVGVLGRAGLTSDAVVAAVFVASRHACKNIMNILFDCPK